MPTASIPWHVYTLDRLSEHGIASGLLARLLRSQQLVLLLGAGASAGMGFPDWNGLVQRCADALGDTTDLSGVISAADLMNEVDRLRRSHDLSSEEMFAVVRTALYGPAASEATPQHSFEVLRNPLLSALGALMMASARGSAGEVFSLNFDDLLEWYLDLHGFSSEVVSDLPNTLRGDVDVHVFHLHGFLPLMRSRYPTSSWMVLSQRELETRLAKSTTYAWETLLLSRMQSKVFLAVGTSMSDTDIKVSFKRAGEHEEIKRPLGFVLGKHTQAKIDELREAGLVPVSFDDYAEIPAFLLEVCQRASRL
jgi:SIR2-like domain